MQVSRESRGDPALLSEIKAVRFIWTAIGSWYSVRNDPTKHHQFYTEQTTKLAEFDQKNPGYKPPAPLPTTKRPRLPLPVPRMGVIVAKGSKPRFPVQETQSPESSKNQRKDIPAPSNRRSPSPRYINRFEPLTRGMPDDIYDDQDAEGSDEEVQPAATMGKDKGKEKTVEDVEEPHARIKVKSVRDPETVQKRLPPVNTGKRRERPCERCVRLNRGCFVQAGSSLACVDCATVKIKCVDQRTNEKEVDDEMEVDIPAPAAKTTPAPTAKDTAQKKKRAPKKKTAPALERSDDEAAGNNPVRAPKKKTAPALERSDNNDAAKPVRTAKKKTATALERSDNDAAGKNPVRAPKRKLATAPAPLDAGGKKRKVVKSNEYLNVTDSDNDDAAIHAPKKKAAPAPAPLDPQGKNRKVVKSKEYVDLSDSDMEPVPALKKGAPKKTPALATAGEQSASDLDSTVEMINRVHQHEPEPVPALKKGAPKKTSALATAGEQSASDLDSTVEMINRVHHEPAPAPALPQSDPIARQDPSGSKTRRVDVTNSEDEGKESFPVIQWKKFEKYSGKVVY